MRKRALLASLALIIVVAALALPVQPARAAESAPYRWAGGDDICGFPQSATAFYFAEGCTRHGFDEWLCILNPSDQPANLGIGFLFPDAPPAAIYPTLQPGTRYTLYVNQQVGAERDVSITVASNVPVVAERPMYFNYRGVWAGNHVAAGSAVKSVEWYFAEGTTRPGFEEWLCVLNPDAGTADVQVQLMESGGIAGTSSFSVGPYSRGTVSVNALAGVNRDVSMRVTSTAPVVAERPMYFNYVKGISGGHDAMGTPATATGWYFAEGTTRAGFDEYLCMFNPGSETATANVSFLTSGGAPVTRSVKIQPLSRSTMVVRSEAGDDKDVSIQIGSDKPIAAERPMYFSYAGGVGGGSVASGSTLSSKTWYFAEGCTREGFDEYLTLMNPETAGADVQVRYLTGATSVTVSYKVEAGTRATVHVNSEVGPDRDVGMVISSNQGIIAERPLYLHYLPQSGPTPFGLATADGLTLLGPVSYEQLAGIMYHEAPVSDIGGAAANARTMQPLGGCMGNDNYDNTPADLVLSAAGDPYYWIETSRYRGTSSTTAVDVGARAGCPVLAPVTGTVEMATSYMLYGAYPDNVVKIRPDGRTDVVVELLHMGTLTVAVGDRVQAGISVVGTVNDLSRYFQSDIGYYYTGEDGNHVHVEVNAQ